MVNKITVNNQDSNYTHSIFDISEYTGNSYSTLSDALDDVPIQKRKGGMTIRYVQTNGGKYVQCRLTANTFTTDITKWQNMSDFVEEAEHPIADNEVAGYLTDKNKIIIAKLMKNGAVEWLVKNTRDIQIDTKFEDIEDFLSYASTELPETVTNTIKYLTDKNGVIIVTINNVGDVEFKGGGGFDGELTKSKTINFDAIKVLTDIKNNVIGWITSAGKVHIIEAEIEKLSVKNNTDIGIPDQLWPMIGLVASGVNNRDVVNDKTYNLIDSFKGVYQKEGKIVESIPCITLYDDDALDNQLPTSYDRNATESTSPSGDNVNKSGYASLLFPLIHAFNIKYKDVINGKVTNFEAAEGQRIGLTKLYSAGDEFTGQLNNNGKVLKKLIEIGEWETVCHSMTARYTDQNYLVDGLDSEFANVVLAHSVWGGNFVHTTTVCYDTVTKKNYQIKQDKSGWTELPLHYAKPYCAISITFKDSQTQTNTTVVNQNYQQDYNTGKRYIINPTYSPKYQVDEWFKRADIAGLPYSMKDVGKRVYANWGTSHSIWHIRQNLKYADYGFGGTANTNKIPLDTAVHRFNWEPKVSRNPSDYIAAGYTGRFNVYTEAEYQRIVDMIDECVENKGWSFLGNHNNTEPCANCYFDELVNFIPTGETETINLYDTERIGDRLNYYDANYPFEWVVPLKYDELQDIIGDNTHDYLNHPPSRLEIDSWDEWYPCPGTGCALLWDVMRYAVSKGVRFITAKEGFERFGNLLTVGYLFTNGEVFSQDTGLGDIPEETKNHCIIGADGSVRYESK